MKGWKIKFAEVRGDGPLGSNVAITAMGPSTQSQLFIGDLDGWGADTHDSQSPPGVGVVYVGLKFERVDQHVVIAHQVLKDMPGREAPFYRLICNQPLVIGREVECISLTVGADPAVRTLVITEMH